MAHSYSYSGGQEDFLNDIADLDMVRLREITAKALSGTLILLLKWFKRSRQSLLQPWSMWPLLNSGRYPEVRIHDAIAVGLELSSIDTEDVRSSGCRPTDCSAERSQGIQVGSLDGALEANLLT